MERKAYTDSGYLTKDDGKSEFEFTDKFISEPIHFGIIQLDEFQLMISSYDLDQIVPREKSHKHAYKFLRRTLEYSSNKQRQIDGENKYLKLPSLLTRKQFHNALLITKKRLDDLPKKDKNFSTLQAEIKFNRAIQKKRFNGEIRVYHRNVT